MIHGEERMLIDSRSEDADCASGGKELDMQAELFENVEKNVSVIIYIYIISPCSSPCMRCSS